MELEDLTRIRGAFMASRVLITANNLRLFEHLTERHSARALAACLSLDARATEIMLDALAAMGVIEKSAAGYINAPVAQEHLVPGKPGYQGDILRHAHSMWQNWSALDEVVRTGEPARRAHDHEAFILGMHNISIERAPQVLEAIDLSGVKRALDLGGGPGTYCIELARRGIEATLFDLHGTLGHAKRLAIEAGASYRLMGGDFLEDPIGEGYDLILLSQILNGYSEAYCRELIGKCLAALAPGGQLVVQEMPLEEGRTAPVMGALFAVNLLVATAGGRTYTVAEMEGWLKAAGFEGIESKRLTETVLLMARRAK